MMFHVERLISWAVIVALVELAVVLGSQLSSDYSPFAPAGDFKLLKRVRRAESIPDDPIKEDDNVLYQPTRAPDLDEEEDNSTEHTYYTMSVKKDVDISKYYVDVETWIKTPNVTGEAKHEHLTSSYRKAASVKFTKFQYPFYGHRLNNVTVATGGFIYVGDQTHSWLAATQYIAPLMANFDTHDATSSILYGEDAERVIVEWNKVLLRDNRKAGPFTFQAQMWRNGDITFVYKEIPIPVSNISDAQHPCKLGISDAYLFNHRVPMDKAHQISPHTLTRRVIHEYHRISISLDDVRNNTVVILQALPTCLNITTCEECHSTTLKNFQCSWCSKPDKEMGDNGPFCSDQFGLNRRRQDWVETCAMSTSHVYCESTNSSAPTASPTDEVPSTTSKTSLIIPIGSSTTSTAEQKPEKQQAPEESGGGGFAFITLLFIIGLAFAGWALYAFYNPHTASGQLLIKYRPSKWQIPSSHVRYSASSIHM